MWVSGTVPRRNENLLIILRKMSQNCDKMTRCVLKSRSYKLRDVNIPDREATIVGRGFQTKIRDRRCSKTQIEITADYKRKMAVIVQLGPNPSQVNDQLLNAQDTVEVEEGSNINLTIDDLKYTLEFVNSDHHSETKNKHQSKVSVDCTAKKFKASTSTAEEVVLPDAFPEPIMPTAPPYEEVMESCGSSAISNHQGSSATGKADPPSGAWNAESMQAAVMNDFNSLSTEDRWEEYDHSKIFIFTPAGSRPREKVAAFDMDNTIICTQSGKVFPTSCSDWKILFSEIPGRIKKLHSEGFKIVLFTNQKGISHGKTSASEFKLKVQRIVQKLGVPIQVLVSTGSGKYRKPNTGMWEYFSQKSNHGLPLNLEECFYVGDAAGRPAGWAAKKKKDFSCADRLFALNVGLKFFTPEEYFLGQKAVGYTMPSFDPRKLKSSCLAVKVLPPPMQELDSDSIASSSSEVIVLVGFPASGKTFFTKSYLIPKGYVHINRDALGTWQKCVAECCKALNTHQKVVIDNTNPDLESRARYIEVSKKSGVPCRCFLFDCSLEQAKHTNVYRLLLQTDDKHVGVNDMVLNSYKSKFKEPSLKEGFQSIVKINFVPKFKNKHEEKLFKRFLIS